MKRKLVVRILALLLTSVMVMETPMQSFAANASDAFVSADAKSGEDSSDASEGTSNASEGSSNALEGSSNASEGSSNALEGSSNASEGSSNASEGSSDASEGSSDASEDSSDASEGSSNIGATGSFTDDNSQGKESTENDTQHGENTGKNADENIDADSVQDAQAAVVTEKTLEIKAAQFGQEPDILSDGDATGTYANLIQVLEGAISSSSTDAITVPVTPAVNATVLNKAIAYILEKKDEESGEYNYQNVLPTVNYTVNPNDYVTSVTLSYIGVGAKATLKAAENWSTDGVSFDCGVKTGTFASLKLRRISLDSDGNPVWDKYTEKEITLGTDGKCTDEPETPGDYAYILFGYDANSQVVTYSNLVKSSYVLPDVTDLSATSDRTGITLSWKKVEPAAGYKVYRMTADAEELNEDSLVATIDDNTQITYKDDAVDADQTYIYKVVAYRNKTDEEGSDKWESQTPAVVTAVSPKWTSGKPAVTFMSPSSDQATLTWDAVSDAEGYEVYTYANGECDYNSAKEVTDTKYQLTGLQAGQVYQYVVCPYKIVEGFRVYGTLSEAVNVETKLGNSTIQVAAAAYNQIKVNWAQTAQADGYELYRNDQLYKTVNGISSCYLVDTVACGTTYNYKVRPFRNVNGKKVYGEFSTQVSAVTSLPATSMNKVTAVDYKTLDVSWEQGIGATGYELYRSTSSNSGFSLVKDITSGSTVTYRDNGLNIGTTYYYKVKAYRTENGKKVYAPESGVILATVTLGTVTGLKATPTAYNRIELTWNKMSYATGYELYYSTSPNGNYKFLKKLGKNSVKFRWSKAQCGVTYYFQIRPIQKVKKVTNYGSFSQTASAMTTIGAPTNVQVSKVTYDSITLKWKAPKGAKQYKIYVADSKDGTYKYLMTTKKKSLTFKNLATGKTYYYKVSAVRDSYESSLSGIVSGTPSIGKLSGLKVKSVSASELQISWKRLKGAEKYVILRSTSANGTYTEVGTTNKTSYTDKNLANSTTYYYKVYAMRGNYKTDACGPANARTKDKGSINTNEDKKSIYKGIDVSQWQGTIDWDAVANDGIDFAMIRILRGKDFSDVHYDTQFKNNYKGARAAGLYVGVYSYSYATTRTQARKEAKAVVEALNGKKLDYPVVMDYEDASILQGTSTNARRAEIILAYKKVIEDAGYKFALYANKNWLDNYIDTGMLGDTHIWIARWRSLSSGHGYNGSGKVTMWQYTDKGSVKGISGKVDMDVSYKKYQ